METLEKTAQQWVDVPAGDVGDASSRRWRSAASIRLLHLGLRDRLLSRSDREGAGARTPGTAHDHDDPRARGAQRRARLHGGEREAVGNRGARRRRDAQLRRRDPHRLAQRPAGDAHRRRAAGRYPGSMLGSRDAAATSGCSNLRPERHRPQVHQVGSPPRISGQSRTDRQPRACRSRSASRAARCTSASRARSRCSGRGRLSFPTAAQLGITAAGRARSRCASARSRAGSSRARNPYHRRLQLGPKSGDVSGARRAVRAARAAGRRPARS